MKIRLRDRLFEIIDKRRCGDHNCIWGKSSGLGTNGGCRSLKMSHTEYRHELMLLAKELLEALDESNCGCSRTKHSHLPKPPGKGTPFSKGN